jgi:dihydrofolate reductase
VSATLNDPVWHHTTVLTGELTAEVSQLKQRVDGDILVYASYQLGQALIEHDLVDEFRLFVFPVVVGAGKRLFGETSDHKPLRLIDTTTIGSGLVLLTYALIR